MAEGWITASYNALNQPMYIWAPGNVGWTYFGYDPLGRCVKRWVAPSPSDGSLVPPPDSNPATYFYYDGWNLIQEGPASGGMIWDGGNLVSGGAGGADRAYVHGARIDELVASANLHTGQLVYHQYDALNNTSMLTGDG